MRRSSQPRRFVYSQTAFLRVEVRPREKAASPAHFEPVLSRLKSRGWRVPSVAAREFRIASFRLIVPPSFFGAPAAQMR